MTTTNQRGVDVQSGSDQHQKAISPGELQEIVRVFADSDLRELRLTVGDVDLLVSRNEHVDAAGTTARTAPGRPVAGRGPVSETVDPSSPTDNAVAEVAAEPHSADVDRTGLVELRSPAVGIFYRRPAPDKAPFVETGSVVAAGDPVGTIEVMKMFTTVNAESAGTVVEVCVNDATLVEHNQVLMYLAPTTA